MTWAAPGSRRLRRGVAAFTVIVLAATSCSSDERAARAAPTTRPRTTTSTAPTTTPGRDRSGTSTTTVPPTAALEWTGCDGGLECAELAVPVDHARPAGETLTLGLARRTATGDRIGSLLVNPGGPGGSATSFVANKNFPAELTERFDIVGFDPRGTGRSEALSCRTHLLDLYDADPTLDDGADKKALLDASTAFVNECATNHGDLLEHLGTVDVARDMEMVRASLGDEQLSYLGYSYGTSIGQQYARLFPTRVRAMVLDGVVDPSSTGIESAVAQAKGFTATLDAFIEDCAANDDCGLDAPAGDVIDDVFAASEKAPIPAEKADRPATPGVVTLAVTQAMYSEGLWPTLARGLGQAQAGNADGLVALADSYLKRNPDGSYPSGFEIYFAVSCLDAAWPTDPDAFFDAAASAGAAYPRFGEAVVNDYVRCALWPVPPQPLEAVTEAVEGLPPIVVISTTGDPATPYQSGVEVAGEIPGAVLVTNEGDRHTIYTQGKPCIDDPVTTYLVALTPPAEDLTCG